MTTPTGTALLAQASAEDLEHWVKELDNAACWTKSGLAREATR